MCHMTSATGTQPGAPGLPTTQALSRLPRPQHVVGGATTRMTRRDTSPPSPGQAESGARKRLESQESGLWRARGRWRHLLVGEADAADGALNLLAGEVAVAVGVDLFEYGRHVAEAGDELLAEDELVTDVPLVLGDGCAVELADGAGAADELEAIVVLARRVGLDRIRLRRGRCLPARS
jgi:hypothetical protein